MKITLFHCSFLYTGGGERIVLEHIDYFKKLGYEVECFVPVIDRKASFPDIINNYPITTLFPQLPAWVPFRHAILLVITCFFAPVMAYRFRKTDLFFGENQPGAWLAFVFASILRKPYVVYLNQPNRVLYPRPVDVKFGWKATVKDYHLLFHILQILKPFLAYLDTLSVIRSVYLFTNGHYIGGVIEKVYKKSVVDAPAAAEVHEPPGASLNYWEGELRIGSSIIHKPYALITNRHDPQKRFDYVIKAMKEVTTNALLVIPGTFTSHTAELQKLAQELGLSERVMFLGPISQRDLQLLYQHACVYCYPSPEEDFGLGPVEAGGWSIPTVAWNNAGPTVTVSHEKTGFLATPYVESEYGRYMEQLFSNKPLRLQMGAAARERVIKEFSWDMHMRRIMEKINKLDIQKS